MAHVIILAADRAAAETRAALYAPLRGVRTSVAPDLSGWPAGSAGASEEPVVADLSLLPTGDLHGAIRAAAGGCRAVLLPPGAALPPDGERIQKLLVRNKLRGFIRNTLFFHPALARMIEVADAGCLGTVTHITLKCCATAHTPKIPALEALFCRRYLAAADVRAALTAETPGSGKVALSVRPAAPESAAGWEICITGSGGTLTAQAPYSGGGGVTLAQGGVVVRSWEVPAEDPGRLCLAAVLTCLTTRENLSFLNFKTAAKTLLFLGDAGAA